MSNWYINLNGVNASGSNSVDNPFSASQFFDLLQGLSVNGSTANATDIFLLRGYYYNPSLVRDSLLNVSVRPWDLLEFGPWVIDSPLEFDMSLVDFAGGIINLNSPDLCALETLRNVMLIAQNTAGKLTLSGGLSEGSTFILKGNTGAILICASYTIKDSTIICENPIESSVSTTLNIDYCLCNLIDGSGVSEFFGGTNIAKGTSVGSQYGWAAPLYSRLPYTGNIPSVRNIDTLLKEKILITPQNVSTGVPNYTSDAIAVELSSGSHTDYEQGLHGENREVDDGSTTNRKYASSGVGAWWFSQEDLEINDTRNATEEGIFNAANGGAFYVRPSDQNSAFIRTADVYKSTSTFPNIDTYITTPGLGNPYFNKFNYSVWVRRASTGVRLWELTDSSGSTTYSKIEVTASNQITVTDSNIVTLPFNIDSSTWHLITITIDQENNNYAKVFLDKTLLSTSSFNVELISTGSPYRIYMPRINSIGKSVELSKPRFAVTQDVLTNQVVFSTYDLEVGELPE